MVACSRRVVSMARSNCEQPDSGRVLSTLGTHATQVAAVEFSPDDLGWSSTGEEFSVILWDVAAQKQRWALPADSERVLSLAFSPDGTMLVGIYNGRLRFWSVASGQPVTPLTQHPDNGSISCVRFSPDGTILAVAEMDRAIHLWDIVSDTRDRRVGRASRSGARTVFLARRAATGKLQSGRYGAHLGPGDLSGIAHLGRTQRTGGPRQVLTRRPRTCQHQLS